MRTGSNDRKWLVDDVQRRQPDDGSRPVAVLCPGSVGIGFAAWAVCRLMAGLADQRK